MFLGVLLISFRFCNRLGTRKFIVINLHAIYVYLLSLFGTLKVSEGKYEYQACKWYV